MSIKLTSNLKRPPIGGLIVAELIKDSVVVENTWSTETSIVLRNNTTLVCNSNNDVLRALAREAVKYDLYGKSPVERTQVDHWLTFSLTFQTNVQSKIEYLQKCLAPLTYLVSNKLTIADLAVFNEIFLVNQASPMNLPNHVQRWYDLIRSQSTVEHVIKNLPADARQDVKQPVKAEKPGERKQEIDAGDNKNKATLTTTTQNVKVKVLRYEIKTLEETIACGYAKDLLDTAEESLLVFKEKYKTLTGTDFPVVNRSNYTSSTESDDKKIVPPLYNRQICIDVIPSQSPVVTPTYCVYFEHIINKAVLRKDEDFKNYIGHQTRTEVEMIGDPELKKCKKGDIIKLQRRGFFKVDRAYAPQSIYNDVTSPIILLEVPDGKEKATASTSKKCKPNPKRIKSKSAVRKIISYPFSFLQKKISGVLSNKECTMVNNNMNRRMRQLTNKNKKLEKKVVTLLEQICQLKYQVWQLEHPKINVHVDGTEIEEDLDGAASSIRSL